MNREERGLYNFEDYQNLKYPVNKKPIIVVLLLLILANFFNLLLQNKDEIKIHFENMFNIVNENTFNNNISEDIDQNEDIISNDDTLEDLSTSIDFEQVEDIISNDGTSEDLSTSIDVDQVEDIISNDGISEDLSTSIDVEHVEDIISNDDTLQDLSTSIDVDQVEDIISNDDTLKELSTSIDFDQVEDIINNDKLLLYQEDIHNISNSLSQYFENIIKAINTGDFSYVENILVKNSNLYNSQKKLVERLYNLGTTERLENFEIIEIDDSNALNGVVKVQVLETISIYYASGESKTSEFNYIYTLENIQNNWLLSDIE